MYHRPPEALHYSEEVPCSERLPFGVYRKPILHRNRREVKTSYDIEKNDVLSAMSIMTTDKPLIPPGYEKSDLIGLLKRSDDLEW